MRAPADSRDYAVAFELRAPKDCPAEFDVHDVFQAGLFLPRDDPDWFGRSSYPPRVLLLGGGALQIHTHPAARQAPQRIPLDELVYLESGHILLHGWLRFVARRCDRTLFYNTCYRRTVDRFMRLLRAAWLSSRPPLAGHPIELGESLDLKFRNALARELDPGEDVRVRLFHGPKEVTRRFGFFRRIHWLPGDLVVLTARRVLWITDRENRRHARYGSIARYAPLDGIRDIAWEAEGGEPALRVGFGPEHIWRVPAPAAWLDDARLLEELNANRKGGT